MELSEAFYLAGWAILATFRIPYRLMIRRVPLLVDRKGRGELLLLIQLAVGWVVLPLLYVFSHRLDFANYALPGWAQWAGALVLGAALWLFWRSHSGLRTNFSDSVQLRQGHELVTSGVYARIRHPMYAGGWLWAVAQVLLLHNWIAGWSSLPTFALLYFLRVPREERMMLEHFGQAYRDYMRRTGQIFPRAR